MLRRQIFSLLAAWGLFFQLAIMGLHVPASIALTGLSGVPNAAQGATRTITICTKSGLAKITVDENNQPVEGDLPPSTGGMSCPICQANSGQALLVDQFSLPVRDVTHTSCCRFSNTALQDHFHPLVSLARAPPRA